MTRVLVMTSMRVVPDRRVVRMRPGVVPGVRTVGVTRMVRRVLVNHGCGSSVFSPALSPRRPEAAMYASASRSNFLAHQGEQK
jgi:hypothetical protein